MPCSLSSAVYEEHTLWNGSHSLECSCRVRIISYHCLFRFASECFSSCCSQSGGSTVRASESASYLLRGVVCSVPINHEVPPEEGGSPHRFVVFPVCLARFGICSVLNGTSSYAGDWDVGGYIRLGDRRSISSKCLSEGMLSRRTLAMSERSKYVRTSMILGGLVGCSTCPSCRRHTVLSKIGARLNDWKTGRFSDPL